jgi:hypothetical protein
VSATREAAPSVVRRRARVGVVVVAVAIAYLAFVGARLAIFAGDPSGFVAAGGWTAQVADAPDTLVVTPGTKGYDGQAYYRLARDPLTDEVTDHGITFGRPAYWQTRIGYPATAWLVAAGGRAPLVPGALLLVNLLAVLAIVLLASRLARELGRSAWWGAAPAAWAGYVVGVGQDLTEPLAGALLMGSLVAMRSGRHAVAALALTAAGLTRETALVLAVAVLLAACSRRPDGRVAPPWWVGSVPLATYLGWRTWVHARWSDLVPDPPSDNPLRAPFAAFGDYAGQALTHLGSEWPNLVLLLPTLVAIVLGGSALRHRDGPPHERLALAGFLVLLACLPVWDRGQAYLRWGCEPMLLAWLLLVGRRSRTLVAVGALSVFVWLVAATQSAGYPLHDGAWSGVWSWS